VVIVPDLLIRNVDEETVRQLDARAEQLGLSRAEFLRREVLQRAASSGARLVTRADLERVAVVFGDALDEGLMERAWR
jgi:hypothetical protein